MKHFFTAFLLLLAAIGHTQSKCSFIPQFEVGQYYRTPSTQAVCIKKTITFTAQANDIDTCDDPYEEKSDALEYEWDFDDGYRATGPTVSHKYTVPGIYNVTCTVRDEGRWGDDQDRIVSIPIEIIELTLVSPISERRYLGFPSNQDYRRRARDFIIQFEARLKPDTIAEEAVVTFYYRKGQNVNAKAGQHDGGGVFTATFDITRKFTKLDDPYYVKATVSVHGETCTTDEHWFHIMKGRQVERMALDWLHYPYHWGGDLLWNGCTETKSHGLPADGYYHHYGYSSAYDVASFDYLEPDHWSPTTRHPACFDCSGFVGHLYNHVGIPITTRPTTTTLASDFGAVTRVHVGDLIFRPGHVMLCTTFTTTVGSSVSIAQAPKTGFWTSLGSTSDWSSAHGPSADGWCMDEED